MHWKNGNRNTEPFRPPPGRQGVYPLDFQSGASSRCTREPITPTVACAMHIYENAYL